MLANSEFIVMLNQASTDRLEFAKLLNISDLQMSYITNVDAGHGFIKVSSSLVPFVDENCDISVSDNIIIYGHYMKGGKMFRVLGSYKDKNFYEQHKIIRFDTLTEKADYEIIAVFKTVAYSSNGFTYSAFINTANENEFNEYVAKCKELSFYDTGLSTEYGNKLITLSTCEYSNTNGRLVVVAKK